jgi:hypothetical protein
VLFAKRALQSSLIDGLLPLFNLLDTFGFAQI